MSYPRHRQPSPVSKHSVDPMRASTGNMAVSSDIDPYNIPRVAYDGYYSSSIAGDRNLESSYRSYYYPVRSPRPNDDRSVDTHPISSYRLTNLPISSRTEYAVRPRGNTLSVADSTRRPLSVTIPSPNRLFAGYDSSRSPRPSSYYAATDAERYIVPASSLPSRHRRIFSSDDREGRLTLDDKETTSRMERANYLVAGRSPRMIYPVPTPTNTQQSIEIGESYSYTNPAEQFYRDFEATKDYRRDNYGRKKTRPLSLTGLERGLPQIPRDSRDSGPPPSARGFDRIGREETHRSSSQKREGSVASYTSDILQRRSKVPVFIHQDGVKVSKHPEYSDSKELQGYRYDDDASTSQDSRHRHHAEDVRYNQVTPIGTESKGTGDLSVSSGLATAGLASGYSKDLLKGFEVDFGTRADERKVRDSVRGPRSSHKNGEPTKVHSEGEQDIDEQLPDKDRRVHRHRIVEHSRREHSEGNVASRRTHHAGDSEYDYHNSKRQEGPSQRASDRLLPNEPIVSTPIDIISDERQRKPYHTEFIRPREPEQLPKGILKPPKDKFPEDRTAVREGIAPLKDTTKKGIPKGARWTKVDRKLVTPAALEGERYEERPDYIIVLRVLTLEEIEEFAKKSSQIRAARYEAYRNERRRHRDDDEHSEADRKPRLAIESSTESRRRSPPDSHHSESYKSRAPRS
ncbi:conserved hypothetical protein [Histoplasma capsulatum var. duboisii H88]|uniref:DUF8035 domain-containing protein n=1 Tax=Ajellomyces capsulatus (strain H88) TaxID=544711 RepID=F0ULX6_AJEC8|nr:conserved hypothetical protein [Histoplasma capsulatum var. duboisii H88]QSS53402.1 hypothetical protein I7I53_00656 [Histoplasma capsulatum var. duboisii H88]